MQIISLKVTDSDSTCLKAAVSHGSIYVDNNGELAAREFEQWVAVPECFKDARKVLLIEAKYDDSVILSFEDGSKKEIKAFCDDSPEEAIRRCLGDFQEDGLDVSNLDNWFI